VSRPDKVDPSPVDEFRKRNWFAIALATIAMMFSYFAYAAAFVGTDDESEGIFVPFVLLGLALAPFVFVILAFVSHNTDGPRRVLWAMGLLLVVGLTYGLLAPVLGATAGFAVGGAITLNQPPVESVLGWRLAATGFTVFYTLILLVAITPAGVFTGGLLPLLMLGFADEYAVWRAARRGS
jgi:MFS family permease